MRKENLITVEKVNILQEPEDTSLPAVIRSELNFLQFPFFSLSWKGLKERTKTEYRFSAERNGKKAELLWRVTANVEYGYPTPFDRKVSRGVDALISEFLESKDQLTNPIGFTIYHLAQLMGLSSGIGGRLYRDIKESFRRIVATTVESNGSFFLKDEEIWLEDIFHMYERVIFKGRRKPNGGIAETNLLWLGEPYIRNINSRYIKPLDYRFLVSLKSDLAARLYEVLSRKFYGLPAELDCLVVDYSDLCQILPAKPQKYISAARQKLDPAHEELIGTRFLSKVKYEYSKGEKRFNVVYYLGKRANEERKGSLISHSPLGKQPYPPLMEDISKEEHEDLLELVHELCKRDLSKSVAIEFSQIHSEDHIREKIEMFELLRKNGSDLISKNPAGWLRKAITEDWQPTEEQKRSKEVEAHKSQEQERQVRWLQHREELIQQDIDAWDNTLLEERVQGRLDAWIFAQSVRPDQDVIEGKLQEIMDNLPKTDKDKRAYIVRIYPEDPPPDFA